MNIFKCIFLPFLWTAVEGDNLKDSQAHTQKYPETHTLTNWPMQTGLKQVTVCRRPPFIHSRVESESRGGRRESDWRQQGCYSMGEHVTV